MVKVQNAKCKLHSASFSKQYNSRTYEERDNVELLNLYHLKKSRVYSICFDFIRVYISYQIVFDILQCEKHSSFVMVGTQQTMMYRTSEPLIHDG